MNEDKQPTVSIVVPAHNAGSFLCRCLDSLLAQTYGEMQIIVVENGSTDSTLSLALSYKDMGVDVCVSAKIGVCAARNMGIDRATGEYIGFVDADDWVEPEYVAEAVSLIVDNGLDIVVGGTEKVMGGRASLLQLSSREFTLLEGDAVTKYISQVLTNNSFGDTGLGTCHASANWCHLFTREIIGNHRFDEEVRYGEDSLFNVEVALSAQRIGVSSNIWYHYLMQSNSAVFRLTRRSDCDIRAMSNKLLNLGYLTPECRQYAFCKSVNALHAVVRRSVNSGLTFRESLAFIKDLMRDGYWESLFEQFDCCISSLAGSRRFMVWCLTHNFAAPLILTMRLNR